MVNPGSAESGEFLSPAGLYEVRRHIVTTDQTWPTWQDAGWRMSGTIKPYLPHNSHTRQRLGEALVEMQAHITDRLHSELPPKDDRWRSAVGWLRVVPPGLDTDEKQPCLVIIGNAQRAGDPEHITRCTEAERQLLEHSYEPPYYKTVNCALGEFLSRKIDKLDLPPPRRRRKSRKA